MNQKELGKNAQTGFYHLDQSGRYGIIGTSMEVPMKLYEILSGLDKSALNEADVDVKGMMKRFGLDRLGPLTKMAKTDRIRGYWIRRYDDINGPYGLMCVFVDHIFVCIAHTLIPIAHGGLSRFEWIDEPAMRMTRNVLVDLLPVPEMPTVNIMTTDMETTYRLNYISQFCQGHHCTVIDGKVIHPTVIEGDVLNVGGYPVPVQDVKFSIIMGDMK